MFGKTLFVSSGIFFWGCLFIIPSFSAENKSIAPAGVAPKAKSNVQRIIFEEQKIEGKIRRPQLVLIKADQRPNFSPMVMQSFGRNDNIAEFVDPSAIESMPNQNAFQFEGTRISNYNP